MYVAITLHGAFCDTMAHQRYIDPVSWRTVRYRHL